MALSAQEKEALEAHYKNKDLYDPSKEPEQQVSDFTPKCECGGGHVPGMCHGGEMGYSDGGEVAGYAFGGGPPLAGMDQRFDFGQSDFSGPVISADTDTERAPVSPIPKPSNVPFFANFLGNTVKTDYGEPAERAAISMPPPAVRDSLNSYQKGKPMASNVPQHDLPDTSAPAGYVDLKGALGWKGESQTPAIPPASDEYTKLMQGLEPSLGQRLGQGALSGLAGLADAITSGVGRAGNPGFQRNIQESRQAERQNLMAALTAKYGQANKEREFGQAQERIGEEGRHNVEAEKETREARRLTQQAQTLAQTKTEKDQALDTARLEEEQNKNAQRQEADNTLWNKAKNVVGLGHPGGNPEFLARAQGNAPPVHGPMVTPKGTRFTVKK